MNTHTIAASVTAQPTGKVIVSIAPGHVIDGALITEVRNEGSHIEAVTEYGDVMAFNHDRTVQAPVFADAQAHVMGVLNGREIQMLAPDKGRQ